jgi:hypothetical protein
MKHLKQFEELIDWEKELITNKTPLELELDAALELGDLEKSMNRFREIKQDNPKINIRGTQEYKIWWNYVKKFYKKFYKNELNTDTYSDLMNKTSDFPWAKFFSKNPDKDTNPKEPGTQQGRINKLSRDRFVTEYYKEFPKGSLTINTSEGKYIFDSINFKSNFTYYDLIFRHMDDGVGRYLWIMPSGHDYFIDRKGLTLTDDKSDKIIRDLLKYNHGFLKK